MLHEFITAHREEIIASTRAKIAQRQVPQAIQVELDSGVPLFMDQLIQVLKPATPDSAAAHQAMGRQAVRHGEDMLRRGFTVAQLVHDYGSICQSVTQFVSDQGSPISAEDYRAMNSFLDDAIAEAVTGYGAQREQLLSEQETGRLGFLAHELRNLLSASMLAFQALRSGRVGISGNTGDALGRSLNSLRDLIDRSLSEVRLASGIERREHVRVAELIEDVEATAMMDAQERGLQLQVFPVPYELVVEVDRQLVESAISNLLQNAFKFTRPLSHVSLRALTRPGRVLIEVEDECGGLPPGKAEELFRPFEQRGGDRSGLGLGLAISLQAAKANGGELTVRNLPGQGCVFTLSLPQAVPASTPVLPR